MHPAFLVAVLAFLFATPPFIEAQETTESSAIAAIADSVAADLLNRPPPVAGVAIAVNRRGSRVFSRAYGSVAPADGEPLLLSDPLRIGSLTKQFTAAAVLRLIEEGRMGLDAPLQEYLPDFDTQGHTVTIRNLLNHTSGIRSYSAIFAGRGRRPVDRTTLLDTIQAHPFDFEPGTRYRYNNSGYYLLGVILEEMTGDSYARHMEQNVFEPLGLKSTSYCGYMGERIPVGFQANDEDLEAVILTDGYHLGASGGLCSTVGDLLDWQDALVSGRVVAPETYRMMKTATRLASGDSVDYGFGLELERLEHEVVVAHGGAVAGFNSRLTYYPERDLGVAVLVNTSTPRAGLIEQAVARAALGMEQHTRVNLPLTAVERTQYVGTYDLGSIRFRVFAKGDNLLSEPTGQPVARLLYQGDDVFIPDVGPEIRIEFHIEGDHATSLTLHQGGRRIDAPRIER